MRLTSFKPNELGGTIPWQRRLPLPVMLFGRSKYNKLSAVLGRFWGGRPKSSVGSALKTVYLLITITVFAASHPHLVAQQVTTQATPDTALPDAPGAVRYPVAEVLPAVDDTTAVTIESDTQSKLGSRYVLDGDVVITYRDRVVKANHVEYDTETGELTANGHLHVTGGANHEDIVASHGTMNLDRQTGRFYDVTGSVGLKNSGHSTTTYANSNPFLFTGRMVVMDRAAGVRDLRRDVDLVPIAESRLDSELG